MRLGCLGRLSLQARSLLLCPGKLIGPPPGLLLLVLSVGFYFFGGGDIWIICICVC